MTTPPVIYLDGENDNDNLLLAKTLGYFYIHRSSSYGEIPDENSLKLRVQELFDLSIEEKFLLNSDYTRSVHLNESVFKKESLAFTKTSQILNTPESIFMKILFNICQQISIHLIHILQLPNESVSTSGDTILFNHYFQIDEPLIINKNEDSILQFHLFATGDLQRLDSFEHEWKSMEINEYILVTLPNCLCRYSINESSNYIINYLCYNINEQIEKRTYFLSLTQNKFLRYFTFFYLYVMQGVPAGFSSTALANYLTAEGEKSSTVGTFVSLAGLPWALQFVWGPLIDRFQSSPMGRRRPWVIASQICAFLASLGLLFVGNPPTQFIKTLVLAFFIHSIFASIQDASVDAQAITTIPLNERGRINGFMRGGFLVGSALGAAGLSWILRNRGYFTAALINSAFLFLFTFITFFIKEKSDDQLFPCDNKKLNSKKRKYQEENDYSIFKLFKELFKGLFSSQSLRLFIPILMVYFSQAAFIRAYNVHLIKVLGWSDTSVSMLSGGYGVLLVLSVALIGGWLADRVGARRLLIVVIAIHAVYMLIANLVEPHWYQKPVATTILVLWNMMDPILSTASMPVLMSLCRKHVEGSQFTTYMSMVNLCDLLGAFISGHLQSHIRANIIGLGCAVLIICAFITVTFSIWYESRHANPVVLTTEKVTKTDGILLKNCWPIKLFTKYHRGSFKVVV